MALKKWALVDSEGNPCGYIQTPDIEDREGVLDTNTGYTYREVDFEKDVGTTDSLWYYDASRETWSYRQPKPSKFHEWTNKLWVLNEDDFWAAVRSDRNKRLRDTDWTQLEDTQLTGPEKAEWVIYRQSLRDVPSNNSTASRLEDIQWPVPPST